MAILMTAHLAGLDEAGYDHVIGGAASALTAASGFRGHVAHATSDGYTVLEIWDSEDEWRQFFDANIGPHLPEGFEPTLTEAHNVLLP